ncbi:hypothetical protein JAAARDRAFT_312905 [Jaapia argillacea MUCL 33604]|uniref:Secreted protein n=1 Tax=Jaapia argillacea MUCL 33604 TaxID=933084 RepID=A0A067PNV5_9AGAM|nr:hypothetical protein JAAARDRAFT_312905 [Jaapia argillacea MUCL 33604]
MLRFPLTLALLYSFNAIHPFQDIPPLFSDLTLSTTFALSSQCQSSSGAYASHQYPRLGAELVRVALFFETLNSRHASSLLVPPGEQAWVFITTKFPRATY